MSMTAAGATPEKERPFGFWRRSYAMLVKEFIQLRRDRVSFAMIVMIPVMQLLLFGYAINTTPRHLPTAVLMQEDSDLARSILKALENSSYFRFTQEVHDVETFDNLLKSGKVLFGVEIPRGFEIGHMHDVQQIEATIGHYQSLAALPKFLAPCWQLIPRDDLVPEIHARDVGRGNFRLAMFLMPRRGQFHVSPLAIRFCLASKPLLRQLFRHVCTVIFADSRDA